ncbi:hypothetical protein FJZ22_03225 [Candidatus Pacearchaeota archaeon]|nr:hypothetical protein [Candidatus Pacearchaeota archaeon]
MKRGEGNGMIENTVIYWIILLLFAGILATFVTRHQGTVDRWEEYYAFSLAQTINRAHAGDVIRVDVSSAVSLGARNKLTDVQSMFLINQEKREVGIRLRPGMVYWYPYVRAVTVSNWKVDISGSASVLMFEVQA